MAKRSSALSLVHHTSKLLRRPGLFPMSAACVHPKLRMAALYAGCVFMPLGLLVDERTTSLTFTLSAGELTPPVLEETELLAMDCQV